MKIAILVLFLARGVATDNSPRKKRTYRRGLCISEYLPLWSVYCHRELLRVAGNFIFFSTEISCNI
jgi:hypothetical protein